MVISHIHLSVKSPVETTSLKEVLKPDSDTFCDSFCVLGMPLDVKKAIRTSSNAAELRKNGGAYTLWPLFQF